MSEPGERMQTVREEVEAIDREILALLKRRMERVEEIAEAKLERAFPFRDPQREDRVLRRLRAQAVSLGLDPHGVEELYRKVMEMSVSRQQAFVHARSTAPLRIAYQGVEGSYSHLTAQRRYSHREGGSLLSGFSSVGGAARAVREGVVDVALLPLENSTAGTILETCDELDRGGLVITAEVVSRIEHCLLGLPGATPGELRRVLSHPQALAQCSEFLATLPALRTEAVFDTAGAARAVREVGDRTLAAIAGEQAARLHGLEVLRKGIQTREGNATRFVEVAREAVPCPPDTPCRTSLILDLDPETLPLGRAVAEIDQRALRLTKIESRPRGEAARAHRFWIDLEGHASSGPLAAALESLRKLARDVRILGTYPRG